MSNAQHTPGPWVPNGNKIDGNGYHLASVNSHGTTEGRANARLIAAAPELLEALQWAVDNPEDDSYWIAQARAAIAKAKGAA